jgi:hypothetical protein
MPIIRFDEYVDENNDARYLDDIIILDGPITQFHVGTRGYCDHARRRMIPHPEGAWQVQNVTQQRYPRIAYLGDPGALDVPLPEYETVRRWTLGNEGNMAHLIVE